MGWYSQGTLVLDFKERRNGRFKFKEAGYLIPENANTWVSHVFDYEKNPDGTYHLPRRHGRLQPRRGRAQRDRRLRDDAAGAAEAAAHHGLGVRARPLGRADEQARRAVRKRSRLPELRALSALRPPALAGAHRSPRRARTVIHDPPATIIATLISCGCVRPRATSSLRRMNSTRRRSVPVRTR